MIKPPHRSRRDALRLIAVSSAAAVAGCGPPEGGGTGPEDEKRREDEDPSGDNETEGREAGGEAEDGADDEWAEVEESVLNGFTAGWEGVEPTVIEGEENPTLVLTEGAEYDLVWENADSQPHNIAT